MDHLNPRKSASETIKFCSGCDKSTRHDVIDHGTLACRVCGHTLGQKTYPVKPSDAGQVDGLTSNVWPFNGMAGVAQGAQ